jgi:AcrR family transcriptional regulator
VARLAKGRTTYLTREEIAAAALTLFDAGSEQMSIRNLAAELGVTTTAIYHHFPSRYDLVMTVVDLVWGEAFEELTAEVGDLLEFQGDSEELFIAGAIAVRRAFNRHWQVAPYVVARASPTPRLAGGLAILAAALERLGFRGEEAAPAFYALAHYTLGAVTVAAARRKADDELARSHGHTGFATVELRPENAPSTAADTGAAMDLVFATVNDPTAEATHEQMFVAGLRSLIRGLRQT